MKRKKNSKDQNDNIHLIELSVTDMLKLVGGDATGKEDDGSDFS